MIFHSIFHSHIICLFIRGYNSKPSHICYATSSLVQSWTIEVAQQNAAGSWTFLVPMSCSAMIPGAETWKNSFFHDDQPPKNPRIQKSKHNITSHHIHHIHHNSPTITATFPSQPPWPAIGSSELGIHLPPAEQIDPWSAAGCWTSGIFNGGTMDFPIDFNHGKSWKTIDFPMKFNGSVLVHVPLNQSFERCEQHDTRWSDSYILFFYTDSIL